jgi:hypothetical protein
LLATLAATVHAHAASADVCALAPIIATLPYSDASATTCGLSSDLDNSGPSACPDLTSSYPGPDGFYRIELGAGNSIAINVELASSATGDLAVFLLRLPGCSASNAAAACAGSSIDVIGAGQGPERIKSHNYAPGTYYIVVDSVNAVGTSAACGAYSLGVTGSLGTITGTGGAGGGAGAGGSSSSGGGSSGGAAAGSGGVGGTIATTGGTSGNSGAGGSTASGGQGAGGVSGNGGASGGTPATGGVTGDAGEGGATGPIDQGGVAGTSAMAGAGDETSKPDGGSTAEAGTGDVGQPSAGGGSSPSDGCSCIVAGARPRARGAGSLGGLALLMLGVALTRRKRGRQARVKK